MDQPDLCSTKEIKKTINYQTMLICFIIGFIVCFVIFVPIAYDQGKKDIMREAAKMGFGKYKANEITGEPKFIWDQSLLPAGY